MIEVGGQGMHGCLLAVCMSALWRRIGSLYAYWDVVKWLSLTSNGVQARLVRCGGRWSKLVWDSKRSGACTRAAHVHVNRISVPRSSRRCGRRRGRWRRQQRPWQYALHRHSSSYRPSEAQAATIERPVRVGEGPGEHVVEGWLGKRVAEFEPFGGSRAPSDAVKSCS